MTLKLEVGKSYRRRDGKRVNIVENKGPNTVFPFVSDDGRCYSEKGRYVAYTVCDFDIVAEWEEPLPPGHARLPCGKTVDLTNPHGTAFGLLDEVYGVGTQDAMRAHGGPYEVFSPEGWWQTPFSPSWHGGNAFRVNPKCEPKVEELALFGGRYNETLWTFENISPSKTWHTHRITLTLRDGVIDAVAKVEVME